MFVELRELDAGEPPALVNSGQPHLGCMSLLFSNSNVILAH